MWKSALTNGAGLLLALLLAVNIVCAYLAAKIVLLSKGIHPRTWWQKNKAKRAMTIYILFWVVTLQLTAVIFARSA